MKTIFRKIILLLICILPFAVHAQEKQSSKDKAPPSSRAQRKVAKQHWKEQRRIDKEEKKAIKEHDKMLQTKETRKRMRKEKRKGEKMRQNKREFFLVRWFKYKRH